MTPPADREQQRHESARSHYGHSESEIYGTEEQRALATDGDYAGEQSPLLDPMVSHDLDPTKSISSNDQDYRTSIGEHPKSSWFLLLLTLGSLGLQVAWSVETGNGSPYLLSLGLSKSMLALVWIAGPITGVLVQPYVGKKSDDCQSQWGRRRPFIVGGCLATALSLLLLAWAKEIVGSFLALFAAREDSPSVNICVMVFAVVLVYVLDFAINVLQAAIRAFIVDNARTQQQDIANAWASRMQGVGNIFGYICGFIKLPKLLPFFGYTQFKVLCAVASIALILTSGISVASIQERDPRLETRETQAASGMLSFFRSLYRSIRTVPPQIAVVCWVQFAAWIAWFPFLFYTSTYIGQLYVEPFLEENPHMASDEVEHLWEDATRAGTFALLIFAITTFVSSVVLPFFVVPSFRELSQSSVDSAKTLTPSRSSDALPSLWIPNLTLRRLWLISHIALAIAMFSTFFVHSVTAGTVLVAFIGLPWSVTNWAPFALISAEISKKNALRRGDLPALGSQAGDGVEVDDEEETGAGVLLGIHNVAISAPQILSTLVSSAIFWALQKPRGAPGDESVAWTLRFAGVCALGAAWLTRKVGEEDG